MYSEHIFPHSVLPVKGLILFLSFRNALIPSLMPLLITNTSLLLCTAVILEGKGNKCLYAIHYFELKMSPYVLGNHSIPFPLFTHPPMGFSYILF